MLLNALFPTRDIGTDAAKIRDWAQAAEELGYHCIEVADHVFGAAPRGDWKPLYSEKDAFHETFTTMAYIAAGNNDKAAEILTNGHHQNKPPV